MAKYSITVTGDKSFCDLLKKFPKIFINDRRFIKLANVKVHKNDSTKLILVFYSNKENNEDKLYITINKNMYLKEFDQTFNWDLSGKFEHKDNNGNIITSDINFSKYFELDVNLQKLYNDELYDLLFTKKKDASSLIACHW